MARDEPEKTKAKPPTGPPVPRRPRTFWLIAVAASVIGLVALGVIMNTIKNRTGETKTTARSESSNQVDGGGKIVEHDRSKNAPPSSAINTTDSFGAKPPTPPSRPDRMPPAGSARLIKRVVPEGVWMVDGDQLIKEGLGDGGFVFGDEGWSDTTLASRRARSQALAFCALISALVKGKPIRWTRGSLAASTPSNEGGE